MVIKTIGSGSIKNMVNIIKSPPSHKITLQKPGNIKSLPLTFCHFAQIPKFPHKILNQPLIVKKTQKLSKLKTKIKKFSHTRLYPKSAFLKNKQSRSFSFSFSLQNPSLLSHKLTPTLSAHTHSLSLSLSKHLRAKESFQGFPNGRARELCAHHSRSQKESLVCSFRLT